MKEIKKDVLDVLKKAEFKEDGALVLSSEKLDRKLYIETDSILKNSGYKWNRKLKCHVPEDDDSYEKLSDAIDSGFFIDEKKFYQFFPTPENIVDKMISKIRNFDDKSVLEPSFGTGNILFKIIKERPKELFGVELNSKMFIETAEKISSSKTDINLLNEDFLEYDFAGKQFDIILANPPFSKFQSARHFAKMFNLLKINGEMVCILPSSDVESKNNKNRVELQRILRDSCASISRLGSGEFKESGTMVSAVMVHIIKR